MDSIWAQKEVKILAAIFAFGALTAIFLPMLLGDKDSTETDQDATSSSFDATAEPELVAPAAEITWQEVQGYNLPISKTNGPSRTEGNVAVGFSQTEQGAALAAIHYLYATSEAAPENMYGNAFKNVLTGPNISALKATIDKARTSYDGNQNPIAGWTIRSYSDTKATVSVYYFIEQGYLYIDADLVWLENDWKLAAPVSWQDYIFYIQIAPEVDLLSSNPSGPQPPTEDDFRPGTTVVPEPTTESALKRFGQNYFAKDYRLTHDQQIQPLRALTTSDVYLDILENKPDSFELRQATDLEQVITLAKEPTVSKVSPESYLIEAELNITEEGTITSSIRSITVGVESGETGVVVNEILVP